MAQSSLPHLLLVNLGTPEAATPEAVREFLEEFLSDPAVVDFPRFAWLPILKGIILRTRPKKVALQYASIWSAEGSPLRVATEFMVRALRMLAADQFTVSSAYRYGEPSLTSAMQRLAREGTGRIIVVPLFPQRTNATVGSVFREARRAAQRANVASRLVEKRIAPDDPGYVDAMAACFRSAIARAMSPPEHLVVSYHGIPARDDRRENHKYTDDCRRTTSALLAAIDWPEDSVTHAYQSKFGPERWLTPATADVLEDLPKHGVGTVAVITPGFITDGLETLEEIGIRGRESFREAGGESLIRVAAVEDHPSFLRSLVALAKS
jgi:protoporphyrin/coproporphyrin ferrochelatase